MIHRKLTALAVATVIGVAMITAPAQARFGGGGGGFATAHFGGFGGGFVRGPGFVGRPGFIGRPGFFPGRRFAFFPGRRFFGLGAFGLGAIAAAGYSSCWTWVPTAFGWRRVWACNSDWGGGWGGGGWGGGGWGGGGWGFGGY